MTPAGLIRSKEHVDMNMGPAILLLKYVTVTVEGTVDSELCCW
jgi:hypothetical protein